MTAAAAAPPAPAVPAQARERAREADADPGGYRRLSVREFDAMFSAGILTEGEKVELVVGIIVQKKGTGSVHDYILGHLLTLLTFAVGKRHTIRGQSPIVIPEDSKPEPDIWISKMGPDAHYGETANAKDIALVVEVADSSIDYDRGTKLGLYAEAGIPEYWIVDLKERLLECYTAPAPERKAYDTKHTYRDGQTFSHALVGEIVLAEVLGNEAASEQ